MITCTVGDHMHLSVGDHMHLSVGDHMHLSVGDHMHLSISDRHACHSDHLSSAITNLSTSALVE